MEKSLKDLLSRLPIPGLKESNTRHIVAEVLTVALKIPIKPKQIDVNDGIVTVAVPPVVKSALQVRSEELRTLLAREGITIGKFR